MLKVTFTESGRKLSLRLEGHAGYAEHGKDIVCASASILAYTLVQIVTETEHEGWLASPPVIKMDSGDTVISCEAKTYDDLVLMKSMFTFAIRGYALLAQHYPQYVRLEP
jgi:uncharacterized protein YsxB (DUF464 family)